MESWQRKVLNGSFGDVEISYVPKMKDDFAWPKPKEIASHFMARFMDGSDSATGLTAEEALHNLYASHAKFKALEDLGRI